jgi:hypothetical protein
MPTGEALDIPKRLDLSGKVLDIAHRLDLSGKNTLLDIPRGL